MSTTFIVPYYIYIIYDTLSYYMNILQSSFLNNFYIKRFKRIFPIAVDSRRAPFTTASNSNEGGDATGRRLSYLFVPLVVKCPKDIAGILPNLISTTKHKNEIGMRVSLALNFRAFKKEHRGMSL